MSFISTKWKCMRCEIVFILFVSNIRILFNCLAFSIIFSEHIIPKQKLIDSLFLHYTVWLYITDNILFLPRSIKVINVPGIQCFFIKINCYYWIKHFTVQSLKHGHSYRLPLQTVPKLKHFLNSTRFSESFRN